MTANREQIERFFRKRILENLSSGIKLDGEILIEEAQYEFDLHELEDGLTLSKILNDVYERMYFKQNQSESSQLQEKINQKTHKTTDDKDIRELKRKILIHVFNDPYASKEKIAEDLNIDVDTIEKLFGKGERIKKRFSPKQREKIINVTLEYLSHFPDAAPEDLEDILFEMFQSKVNVRNVLAERSFELEKRGDKKNAKII